MADKIISENPVPAREGLVCKNCGTYFVDFEKTGLLGCPMCYYAFEIELKPLLRQIHGSDKHIGSRPVKLRKKGNTNELNQLRENLHTAIEAQKYEEAARLRDLIKDIERQSR